MSDVSREAWLSALRADPRPWLLDPADPAVRHVALRWLEDRGPDDPEVAAARRAAMAAPPIGAILAAQDPAGWWMKPGPGYGPKYTGTVWSLMFLEQLGADPADERVQRGCDYVLAHTVAGGGGFGASGVARDDRPPPPSSVYHCLTGNLVRALVAFGRLDDPRVTGAIDWQARAILGGADAPAWFASGTSGPGFACGINEGLPCGWGAVKSMRGLEAIPEQRRTPAVRHAIEAGVAFLLSVDPATAAYPMGWGNTMPSRTWFRPSWPSGYTADVLGVLEVLAELGRAADPRAAHAVKWLVGTQDADGRWTNASALRGRMHAPVDPGPGPSRWVTLRACRVLRAALG